MLKILYLFMLTFVSFSLNAENYCRVPESKRSAQAKERVLAKLKTALQQKKLELGSNVFVRIFKKDKELELWIKGKDTFQLFKTYPICAMSGVLGPKMKQGDKQAPEGFYTLSADSLHPNSRYHLALNVGYPNHYDKAMDSTGSHIMIHGDCRSIGCFAMTDPQIEEIYTLIHFALEAGQKQVPLHIFPFHLKPEHLKNHIKSSWYFFWSMLQPIYLEFEKTKIPPVIKIKNRLYCFAESSNS
ncbi:MAG: L,D-transpeptidase family protein [Alphaproteobacteria bacterium]|jgi:murein L,D-transpeptidase YafK|nr:L,D-transpeptidase family protein [Alphaproteobacteria bacterium]